MTDLKTKVNINYNASIYDPAEDEFVIYAHTQPVTLYDSWSTDVSLIDLPMRDEALRFYHALSSDNRYAMALVEGANAKAFITSSTTSVGIYAAGMNYEAANALIGELRIVFPEVEKTDDTVPMKFWSLGPDGPGSTERRLEVPEWSEIAHNYTIEVREKLERFFTKGEENMRSGQLALWYGEPGTGKTYALRALAREWKDWCDFHFIADPDQFFGQASYMMNVLLGGGDRWRVLILEDSGELLSADAQQRSGQGLSRLLNTVDGLIGQGLKIFVLVTTNEELRKLHPAVARPGRCASRVEFKPLTPEESAQWLEDRGIDPQTPNSKLVDLFAQVNDFEESVDNSRPLGFV